MYFLTFITKILITDVKRRYLTLSPLKMVFVDFRASMKQSWDDFYSGQAKEIQGEYNNNNIDDFEEKLDDEVNIHIKNSFFSKIFQSVLSIGGSNLLIEETTFWKCSSSDGACIYCRLWNVAFSKVCISEC